MITRKFNVLLVEDDPADVELTQEYLDLDKFAIQLQVVDDGVKALAHLRQQGASDTVGRPDLILLDLNLPKMDGREVLQVIKDDPALRTIPVVVLTTSDLDEDILQSYDLGANCYVTKPIGLKQLAKIVRAIEDFWFTVVKLP